MHAHPAIQLDRRRPPRRSAALRSVRCISMQHAPVGAAAAIGGLLRAAAARAAHRAHRIMRCRRAAVQAHHAITNAMSGTPTPRQRSVIGALASHLCAGRTIRRAAGTVLSEAVGSSGGSELHASGLSAQQLHHYREHGYVVVRGALLQEDFHELELAYDALITMRAKPLFEEGILSSLHVDAPFDERLALLVAELPPNRARELTSGLDIYQARLPQMFNFFFTPRLLSLAESILGPELTLSPIQHIRPHMCAEYGGGPPQWHMDQAVTLEEADRSEVVTCWVPLVDVRPSNGCLQVLRDYAPDAEWRTNRDAKLVIGHHAADESHAVPAPFLDALARQPNRSADAAPPSVVDCDARKGDVVILNAYTPHRGQQNMLRAGPHAVRWSLDLRFQRSGTPTGRPHWPEIVVQSKKAPTNVQRSNDQW